MVKDPANENAYSERFDLDRLREIANLALSGKGTNGTFSDLECHVHSLFCEVIRKSKIN